MGWKDLLQTDEDFRTLPWVGGRILREGSMLWKLEGPLPVEHGWAKFKVHARRATFVEIVDPNPDVFKERMVGYLAGDRLIPDDVSALEGLDISRFDQVRLIEPGLDRFVRVSAGRISEDSPLVFIQQEMPMGPEFEVQDAFLENREDLTGIQNVTPALEVAFRLEAWRRAEVERRRRELEERLRLEEEERQLAERRREIAESLGDGARRRELALHDFGSAAKAALTVGGAEYLDHRPSYQPNEMVVLFSLNGRRFECVAHARTLQIIDSGICLTAEYNDGYFEAGTRGDTFFSLESLPSVIREAQREGRLVVYRHVD